MTKDTGGPAYPTNNWQKVVPLSTGYSEGMTMRDYFAAKAMQAMLTSPEFMVVVTADQAVGANARERVSNVAYRYADAMLEARK